jgi:hypothetical protein
LASLARRPSDRRHTSSVFRETHARPRLGARAGAAGRRPAAGQPAALPGLSACRVSIASCRPSRSIR